MTGDLQEQSLPTVSSRYIEGRVTPPRLGSASVNHHRSPTSTSLPESSTLYRFAVGMQMWWEAVAGRLPTITQLSPGINFSRHKAEMPRAGSSSALANHKGGLSGGRQFLNNWLAATGAWSIGDTRHCRPRSSNRQPPALPCPPRTPIWLSFPSRCFTHFKPSLWHSILTSPFQSPCKSVVSHE